MIQATRRWLAGTLAIGAMLFVFAGSNSAQDKNPYEKHDASALNSSLRDVINAGAKMFNEQGDHAGCYRLYQGSLLSVRTFLSPELQKKIDLGIARADQLPTYADRAFELRRVLDEIRATTKPAGTGAKTSDPKGDKGQVGGKLVYQGKAVAGGYFVTLIDAGGKKFSSAIQKDGSFSFKTPIPSGEYQVAVEPITGDTSKTAILPARYRAAGTSGLTIRVQAGKQTVDLNLVN
ncbi:MAG: hypothetical protein EXR98_21390 [Gemmataceae bacterium]|nr:hypothetical protein [Gemmataceae bacterium]